MFGRYDYHDDHEAGFGFGGFLLGVLVGAGAALLLAPKRGDELRHDLTDNAEKLKAQGSDLLETAKSKGADVASQAQSKIGDIKTTVSQKVGHAQEAASEAVDKAKGAGKDSGKESGGEAKLQAHLAEMEEEQPSGELGPDDPSPEKTMPNP